MPPLADAEADGLFHPNCVHRLEYVDDDELPEEMRKEAARQAAAAANPPPPPDDERKSLADALIAKMHGDISSGRQDVFEDVPLHILRTFDKEIPAVKDYRAEGLAHPTGGRDGTVYIGQRPNTYNGSAATFFHEAGHAILFKEGQEYGAGKTVAPKFQPILDAAKREARGVAARLFGDDWETSAVGASYGEVAGKTGISGHYSANISDLLHSATSGRQFSGHGEDYYRQSGTSGEIHEIVADATSLLCSPHADAARQLMPDTFRLVEELVYGKQS